MTTTRKTIRHAIKDALLNNTSAGAHVYASRTRPIPATSLPAILVYTNNEAVEIFNESPREYRRTLTLGIEIAARADEALDDTLDDIAQEIERILSENQTPGGADTLLLTGAEIVLTKDGDNQHGSCVLTYDAIYFTLDVSEGVAGPGVPADNVLTPFERGGVVWRPNGATEDSPQAEDEILLTQ
ncbi:MAG: hypothetical protein AB7U34_05375 [Novosphingobium sp.]